MKFLKYLLISLTFFGALIFGLLQLSGVQDFLAKKAIERQFQQADFFSDEDALSALVCGSRSPFPDPNRAETCILIKAGENIYIVDIGDGSATKLQMWQIDLSKL